MSNVTGLKAAETNQEKNGRHTLLHYLHPVADAAAVRATAMPHDESGAVAASNESCPAGAVAAAHAHGNPAVIFSPMRA
jgi:hypothetical protein